MTKQELTTQIINDLGANYLLADSQVISDIIDDVVNNALIISNRTYKNQENSLTLLSPEIKRCVKTIYLQRGTEDVTQQSQSGISASYDNAMERMRTDIIKNGKRLLM